MEIAEAIAQKPIAKVIGIRTFPELNSGEEATLMHAEKAMRLKRMRSVNKVGAGNSKRIIRCKAKAAIGKARKIRYVLLPGILRA